MSASTVRCKGRSGRVTARHGRQLLPIFRAACRTRTRTKSVQPSHKGAAKAAESFRRHAVAENAATASPAAAPTPTYDPDKAAALYGSQPLLVLGRVLQVAAAVLTFLAFRVGCATASARAPGAAGAQPADAEEARLVCRLLTDLGPAWVKLGQTLSMRPDVVGARLAAALCSLQDSVQPFDHAAAMALLEQELGAPTCQLFTALSPLPVASASFGQVYLAELAATGSGQRQLVAVKVQRPGAWDSVALDLHVLRLLVAALRAAAGVRQDVRRLLDEMGRGLAGELDYTQEAANMEAFARAHRRLDYLVVPQVYWRLTTRRVLTSEWLEGSGPGELLRLAAGDGAAGVAPSARRRGAAPGGAAQQQELGGEGQWRWRRARRSAERDGCWQRQLEQQPVRQGGRLQQQQQQQEEEQEVQRVQVEQEQGSQVAQQQFQSGEQQTGEQQPQEHQVQQVQQQQVQQQRGQQQPRGDQQQLGRNQRDAARRQLLSLLSLGIDCCLSQLLESGLLHADPHGGNVVALPDGRLGLLDFGLVARVPPQASQAMSAALMHWATGAWRALAEDLRSMQLLKPDTDLEQLATDLQREFMAAAAAVRPPGRSRLGRGASPGGGVGGSRGARGSSTGNSSKDVMGGSTSGCSSSTDSSRSSSSPLGDPVLASPASSPLLAAGALGFGAFSKVVLRLAVRYRFELPPYYTLVIRSLATLEGLALAVDPDFRVVAVAVPVLARKLLGNTRAGARQLLREVVMTEDGALRLPVLQELLRLQQVLQQQREQQQQQGAAAEREATQQQHPSLHPACPEGRCRGGAAGACGVACHGTPAARRLPICMGLQHMLLSHASPPAVVRQLSDEGAAPLRAALRQLLLRAWPRALAQVAARLQRLLPTLQAQPPGCGCAPGRRSRWPTLWWRRAALRWLAFAWRGGWRTCLLALQLLLGVPRPANITSGVGSEH